MRRFSFRAIYIAATVGIFTSAAQAIPVNSITFYDGNTLHVQSVVGTGSNVAYEAIDLPDGTDVAWQYDFNGTVNGWQMLSDIAAADNALLVTATYYPSFSEHYVNNFEYGGDPGVLNMWDFFTGSYSSSNVSSTDPQGTTWASGSVGIDQENITSGELIGWVDKTHPTPQPTLAETEAPVPEPASLSLALTAGGLLLRRRRR